MKKMGFYGLKLAMTAFVVLSALGISVSKASATGECLTSPRQLLDNKVSYSWKELHQKDNQPLLLLISAGQGKELNFVGKKPDGRTWISGAMSVCPYNGNSYRVTIERIDQAPFLVASNLTGISEVIAAGSSRLRFGRGQHCGNPDPCIEFAAQ